MPERLVSDRGTAFTSKIFHEYCTEHRIKHILVAVRTPRANGQVERMNRTIQSMLLPSTENDRKCDSELRKIQWSINSLKNSSSGRSPHELLFGFQPRDILGNQLALVLHDDYCNDVEEVVRERNDNLAEKRQQAADHINAKKQKAKTRFDSKHSRPGTYEVGDLVLVGNEAPSTGSSRKLEPPFKGPFIITKVLDHDRYVVEDLPSSRRTRSHYSSVYASDGLKP